MKGRRKKWERRRKEGKGGGKGRKEEEGKQNGRKAEEERGR